MPLTTRLVRAIHTFLTFLSLGAGLPSGYAFAASDLDYILDQTRRHAIEPQAELLNKQMADAQLALLQAAFDTTLYGQAQKAHDKGKLNDATTGDERWQSDATLGVRTLFSTGTALEISSQWRRQEVSYGNSATLMNPLLAPRNNPEHQFLSTITLTQSLWRNFMTREINLRQQVQRLATIQPEYRMKLNLQLIQGEAETLYWQLIGLNEQIRLLEDLLVTAKKFAESMQRRRSIGRADDVDVAEAEAMIIARESQILETRVKRDEIQRHLKIRAFGLQTGRLPTSRHLPGQYPHSLPARQPQEALRQAQQSRYDLRLLKESKEFVTFEHELAEELGKPNIDAFASFQKRGLAGDFDESLDNLKNGTVTAVGLQFSWQIDNSNAKQRKTLASLRDQELTIQQQVIERDLAKEFELAFLKIRSTRQQRELASSQIKVLERKRTLEERKLRQARSDEVAVLRYDLEVQAARIERLSYHLAYLLAHTNVRLLLHAYPVSNFATQ